MRLWAAATHSEESLLGCYPLSTAVDLLETSMLIALLGWWAFCFCYRPTCDRTDLSQRDLPWWLLWTTCVIAVWYNWFFFLSFIKKKLDLIFSKVLDFRLKWTSGSQFHRIIYLIIFPLCTSWFTVHLHVWLCDWHRPLPPMRCWQSSYTAHNKYSF